MEIFDYLALFAGLFFTIASVTACWIAYKRELDIYRKKIAKERQDYIVAGFSLIAADNDIKQTIVWHSVSREKEFAEPSAQVGNGDYESYREYKPVEAIIYNDVHYHKHGAFLNE